MRPATRCCRTTQPLDFSVFPLPSSATKPEGSPFYPVWFSRLNRDDEGIRPISRRIDKESGDVDNLPKSYDNR